MLKRYNADIESSDGFELIVQTSLEMNVLCYKYPYYTSILPLFSEYKWRIAVTALLSFVLK